MKHILSIFLLFAMAFTANAQNGLQKAADKMAKNTEESANSIDGPFSGKTYKLEYLNNAYYISGLETIYGLTDEMIFVNTLSWMIQQGKVEKEFVKEVDYKNMRAVYEQPIESAKSSSTSYKFTMTLQVAGETISFTISDVEAVHTGLLNSYRSTAFNKMSPDKNKKQAETIKDFEKVMSKRICALLNFIEAGKAQKVTHWDEVLRGNVVKGMNETECLLSLGKPMINDMTGGKTRWVYDARTYIFFEAGKVSTFLK